MIIKSGKFFLGRSIGIAGPGSAAVGGPVGGRGPGGGGGPHLKAVDALFFPFRHETSIFRGKNGENISPATTTSSYLAVSTLTTSKAAASDAK